MNPRVNYREARQCGNCTRISRLTVATMFVGPDCSIDGTTQPVDSDWVCDRHEYREAPKRAEHQGEKAKEEPDAE